MQVLSTLNIAIAQDNELFGLCSRFPHKSKCKGYSALVSLEDRPEENSQSLLGENESCKISLKTETLTLYIETGKELDILDGNKDTK